MTLPRVARITLNPARAARDGYAGAGLTADHFDLPAVRVAARLAARVAAGEGLPLGRGNFGVATLLDGHVVKLPAERNLRGEPWAKGEIRGYFLHEAGVANELAEAGHTVAPVTVYAELPDGTPALVREYGDDPGEVSVEEIGALESALLAVEAAGDGWDVDDELLVFRRADGSLFIGDVGFWRARESGKPRPSGIYGDSHVFDLLARWVRKEAKLPPGVDGETLAKILRESYDVQPRRLAELEESFDKLIGALEEDPTGPDAALDAGFLAEEVVGSPLTVAHRRRAVGLALPEPARKALERWVQRARPLVEPYGFSLSDPPPPRDAIERLKRRGAWRKRQAASARRL